MVFAHALARLCTDIGSTEVELNAILSVETQFACKATAFFNGLFVFLRDMK